MQTICTVMSHDMSSVKYLQYRKPQYLKNRIELLSQGGTTTTTRSENLGETQEGVCPKQINPGDARRNNEQTAYVRSCMYDKGQTNDSKEPHTHANPPSPPPSKNQAQTKTKTTPRNSSLFIRTESCLGRMGTLQYFLD